MPVEILYVIKSLVSPTHSRASEVISCLDRVHQLKKERVKPSSLYLKLILEQSGYFSAYKNKGETEPQQVLSVSQISKSLIFEFYKMVLFFLFYIN